MGFLRMFRREIWETAGNTDLAKLHEELSLARDEYEQAMENFKHASPEYIDAAIAKLNAAEIHLNTLIKEIRKHHFRPSPGSEAIPKEIISEETIPETDEQIY